MPTIMNEDAVTIDGQGLFTAELHQNTDWIDVSTEHEPDPNWVFIDTQGHLHAFSYSTDDGVSLPTLDAHQVEVPCSGSCGQYGDCEGYTRTEHRCVICAEVIEPKMRRTRKPTLIPGLRSWQMTFTCPGMPALGRKVSVVWNDENGPCRFGIALITEVQAGPDGVSGTALGVGELGQRKARKKTTVTS